MAVKTFAQYLIDKALPPGMRIERQIDSGYLKELLQEVAVKHNALYDKTVTALKRLGDRFSTLEPVTMGMDEISVPNRERRDEIIKKYTKLVAKEKDKDKLIEHLTALQNDLARNDLDGTSDDASTMVRSALKSNKYQLMKLRTSPGVVADHSGNVVPIIFPKSYAEGVDPLQFWLGAVESRKNIAEGQVATAKPGELNKVLSNILNTAVVSRADCGTGQGIVLAVKDDDSLNRYLARKAGRFDAGTLITADVQQDLLRAGVQSILVRSPQTCQAPGGSVCQKCMGLRPGTGKPYAVGDNAGLITAGSLGEPLTQMTLSAKHSTSLAKKEDGLRGEKGFRQFIESPKSYPNRKLLCEVFGVIYRIRMAPQGGWLITIRETRPVPARYIIHAMPTDGLKRHWDYHIPPNLKLAQGLKEGLEVHPGMELSSGVDNLQDVARLRNLGVARSVAAQNMYDIYKNTGNKMDRRHFELLARNANPYVKLERIPAGFGFTSGETVEYNQLKNLVAKMPSERTPVDRALGKVLAQGVLDLTIGTEIDANMQKYLQDNSVTAVQTVRDLEISAAVVPMTRVVNQSSDFIAALNHRYLKDQLRDAAAYGKKSNIHGYNPITAYAYGVEMRNSPDGKY